MHPDGAVAAVVQDQNDRMQPCLQGCAKFGTIHLKITITSETQHKSAAVMRLGRQRCGQPEPHRPALRTQQPLVAAILHEFVGPDREVASPVGDDGISWQARLNLRCYDAHIHITGLGRRHQ